MRLPTHDNLAPLNSPRKRHNFTLKKVESWQPAVAPCMQVNDDYYESLTPEMADQIIDDLRAGKTQARHVTK